ncbi:hypothetical protein D3C84_1271740 [compost metagenome]
MAWMTAEATVCGSSTLDLSASFKACAAGLFMLVRVARGATYNTPTRVSANSRRRASENPRRANLLAQ